MRTVAGIDAHSTYVVVTIVSNEGEQVAGPKRIRNDEAHELVGLPEERAPLEVVVEANGSWPRISDRLEGPGVHVVLAHPKKLRAIAESNYKTDAIDAELWTRMRFVDLIPEVYRKPIEQRELATLVRHRARLVRQRTGTAGPIHGELRSVGLSLRRGELLTQAGRRWVHTEVWPLLGPSRSHWSRRTSG